MYRILLVDDESYVVDWLSELLKYLQGYEVDVFKAYSAAEAMKWMQATKIDIMITDICMPEMDGLQLTEKIHCYWPKCRLIYLTGYNNFDYAYTAIQNDAVSYLLKTERDDKIIEAVHKAIRFIEEDMHVNDLLIQAEKQIKEAIPILQKEYFTKLLEGCGSLSDERKRRFAELEVALDPEEQVILILESIDDYIDGADSTEKGNLVYAVRNITAGCFSPWIRFMDIVLDNMRIAWVLQLDTPMESDERGKIEVFTWEQAIVLIKGTVETVQSKCRETLRHTVSFAMNGIPFQWEDIDRNFAKLSRLLKYRIGMSTEMFLIEDYFNDSNMSQITDSVIIQQKVRNKIGDLKTLKFYLERGLQQKFREHLDELLEYFKKAININIQFSLEIYYSISLFFLSYINEWGITEKISDSMDISKLMKVEGHQSLVYAAEYFRALADSIFKYQQKEYKDRTTDVVFNVKEYIHQHLPDDISLSKIADTVHFNPSYLSRLFKQEIGMNISEYIYSVKLDKAKKQLIESEIRVNDLAASLGFQYAPHFTRFFKRTIGLSPKEYREQFRNK